MKITSFVNKIPHLVVYGSFSYLNIFILLCNEISLIILDDSTLGFTVNNFTPLTSY